MDADFIKQAYSDKRTFIKLAKTIHGNKYSYAKIKLNNSNTRLVITCKVHGDFIKSAYSHIGKPQRGCNKCAQPLKYWDEVVRLANTKYNNAYTYKETANKRTMEVTCAKHGKFVIRRFSHLNGNGCTQCSAEKAATVSLSTHKAFLQKNFKGTVALVSGYVDKNTLAKYRFSCGHTGNMRPGNIEKRPITICNSCARSDAHTMSEAEVQRKLKSRHGTTIQLVGQYRKITAKARFRCNVCQSTWKSLVANLIKNKPNGCPNCGRLRSGIKSNYKKFEIDGHVFTVQGYEQKAIEWIIRNTSLTASDLLVDTSGKVPTFNYRLGRRTRRYFPDIFIPKKNTIVEVKSTYTLGLDTGRDWKKNQAKAKAVLAAGYKFSLLVMDGKGNRKFKLPENWYNLSRLKVLNYLAAGNAYIRPNNVAQNKPIKLRQRL